MEDFINNKKNLINVDISYRLDSTILSKKEKHDCCKGKSNKENKIRTETYATNVSSASSKKESEEEIEF